MIVWVLTLFGLLLSVTSSLVLPTYLGFDEPQHVDMVVALAEGDGWAGPGERFLGAGISRSASTCYGAPLGTKPLDKALVRVPARGQRKSLPELGGDVQVTGGNPNQIVQHPPLYYAIQAVGVRLLGAYDWSYDTLVELMRLLDALLLTPLPLLVWAMSRRLQTSSRVGVAAAALSLGVPGLARTGGMVNNDAFLVLTATAMLLGLLHVATGDLSRRTAVVVGLLTGLALLSKGFGLTLLPLVVLAYVLGLRAASRPLRTGVRPLALALFVGFLSGGIWWARNIVVYGHLQTNGFGEKAAARIAGPPRPANLPATLGPYLHAIHVLLMPSFWGGIGVTSAPTMSVRESDWLTVLAALLVVAGIAWGVRGQGNRLALLLLTLPLPLAMLPFLSESYRVYVSHNLIAGLQGRYLYLAVAGLALAGAVAADRLLGKARDWLPVVAVVAVLAMQLLNGVRLVRSLWLPPSGGTLRAALTHLEVLSPWSRYPTEAVFLVTGLVGIAVLVLSVLTALAKEQSSPATEPAPVAVTD